MAGKSVKGKVSRSKPVTGATKANIVFAPARIARLLRRGRYADRIGLGGPVFLAGVLSYLASEILEISGDICLQHKKGIITPRHLQLAISNDDELMKMMATV